MSFLMLLKFFFMNRAMFIRAQRMTLHNPCIHVHTLDEISTVNREFDAR